MPRQTYRVTTEANAHYDPATWREYTASSPTEAAEDYVEDDEPGEDCGYEVVVLCPDGARLCFAVDVSIVRHYDVSPAEED